jgi:hypothetical protein
VGVNPRQTTEVATMRSRSVLTGPLTRRTSLSIPPGMSLDAWRRVGRQIFVVADSSAWWLGDWLIYGRSQYPDRYQRAIAETSLDYQTLRNYAWVARQFSVARRRESLSFQHHAELASLTVAEQDLWLDRAQHFGWSRNALRQQVRASRNAVRASPAATPVTDITVRVVPDRSRRWEEAAATAQQDLLAWMTAVLDDAATSTLDLGNGRDRSTDAFV